MEPYANIGGNSGVAAYEIFDTGIIVAFRSDGSMYAYDYEIPGRSEVEEMKQLAAAGQGLNGYINRHIKKRYRRKLSPGESWDPDADSSSSTGRQ